MATQTHATIALIYTRTATVSQADPHASLDAQRAVCAQHAAAQGWPVGDTYADLGSGRPGPAFAALLRAAEQHRQAGGAVVVVVAHADRLSRRTLEQRHARAALDALGVPLHSVHEGGAFSELAAAILSPVLGQAPR
jgi:DNA invertase Pin-like site-specific DNA recombinase